MIEIKEDETFVLNCKTHHNLAKEHILFKIVWNDKEMKYVIFSW
jgi:hypothetical protein